MSAIHFAFLTVKSGETKKGQIRMFCCILPDYSRLHLLFFFFFSDFGSNYLIRFRRICCQNCSSKTSIKIINGKYQKLGSVLLLLLSFHWKHSSTNDDTAQTKCSFFIFFFRSLISDRIFLWCERNKRCWRMRICIFKIVGSKRRKTAISYYYFFFSFFAHQRILLFEASSSWLKFYTVSCTRTS